MFQPLVDKVQSWNRNRKYKEGNYFKIVPNGHDRGLFVIELLKGPFKGIIYAYGSISIGDDLGPKGSMASFDIEIVNQNKIGFDPLADTKFCGLAGEILLVVLEKAIKVSADKFYSENLDEEVREDYIEEFVPKRTVSSKNSPVSEERVPTGQKRKNSVRRNTKVRSKVQSDSDA